MLEVEVKSRLSPHNPRFRHLQVGLAPLFHEHNELLVLVVELFLDLTLHRLDPELMKEDLDLLGVSLIQLLHNVFRGHDEIATPYPWHTVGELVREVFL